MMRLPKFHYYAPRTVAEALTIRSGAGPDAAYVAGGTDLYPNMKRRQQTPKVVVGLSRVVELSWIGDRDGRLALGAGLILSTVENDPRVRRDYPGLAHAVSEISTPPLRNMGTIGGNLLLDTRCNYYDQNFEWRQAIDFCMKTDRKQICWVAPGSPKCLAVQSADTVPVLIAMGARAVLASPGSEREVAVEDLYRNDGIDYVTKRPDELLTEVRLPGPRDDAGSAYASLEQPASGYAIVGVATVVIRSAANAPIGASAIAITGVGPVAYRASAVEKALTGSDGSAAAIAAAAAHATDGVTVNSDIHADREYRTEIARVFTVRAIEAALARLG